MARVNGLNANMIHTWRREALDRVAPSVAGGGAFVPLRFASSPVAAAVPPIRIEQRHGATTVAISGLSKPSIPARRGCAPEVIRIEQIWLAVDPLDRASRIDELAPHYWTLGST